MILWEEKYIRLIQNPAFILIFNDYYSYKNHNPEDVKPLFSADISISNVVFPQNSTMWGTILQIANSKIRQIFLDFIFNVMFSFIAWNLKCGIGHHVTLGYHDSKNFIKPVLQIRKKPYYRHANNLKTSSCQAYFIVNILHLIYL